MPNIERNKLWQIGNLFAHKTDFNRFYQRSHDDSFFAYERIKYLGYQARKHQIRGE